jgi:hypothetical protein
MLRTFSPTSWKRWSPLCSPFSPLSKLEGDACFAYAEAGRVNPTLILDTVEVGYFDFRRRLPGVDKRTGLSEEDHLAEEHRLCTPNGPSAVLAGLSPGHQRRKSDCFLLFGTRPSLDVRTRNSVSR